MRSPPTATCSPATPFARAHTDSASGHHEAATHSAAPTTCAKHSGLVAIGLLAFVLAACGGHHPATRASRIHQGAALFKSNCAACHTLNAAASTASGGDLARPVLSIPDLVSFARIMPVELTPAQLYAVALYLHTIQTRTRARS
jgi:mono/diheme cytochrome c family protein